MAAKLVSMKLDKAEQKKMMEPSLAEGDRPLYPWGLSINLDTDALDKLGLKEMPDVGESYMLVAMVDVTNVSSNESEGGSNRSVGLQITEMCLESGAKNVKSVSDALYGAGGKA
jgi:hypothetical protein